jgi:UTP--glucose-1-phosphate uridylyltransferase
MNKPTWFRNILPDDVERIFVRQPKQLGLGHAVLCAERAVGSDPFAVLLADDFLTNEGAGIITYLTQAFAASGNPAQCHGSQRA